MGFIKDTFFGGAEKKAAQAQQESLEKGLEFTKQAAAQARSDVQSLFPAARDDIRQSFQGALDVFGRAAPARATAFRTGNLGAQRSLLSGLDQQMNAILGRPIDTSQLRPQVVPINTGFLNQQLPIAEEPAIQPIEQPQVNPLSGAFGNNPLSGGFGGFGQGFDGSIFTNFKMR